MFSVYYNNMVAIPDLEKESVSENDMPCIVDKLDFKIINDTVTAKYRKEKLEFLKDKISDKTKSDENEDNFSIVEFDCIQKLESYTSYALCVKNDGITYAKQFQKGYLASCVWINLNRLGVATKQDYATMIHLYGYKTLARLDTGVISNDVKDIILNICVCTKENILIESDLEYTINPISILDGIFPRRLLWDDYALVVNDKEYHADNFGELIYGNTLTPIICEDGKDYIEFTVKKYQSLFKQALTRDVDNEEVLIECTAGLCNPTRIRLKNGIGTFRIYPFGYIGYAKIKLGRKWYTVWDDYCFNLGLQS